MQTLQALKTRKCVRQFLAKPVAQEKLQQLFDAARWTPSSKNTQPWKIAVVSEQKKIDLMNKILAACNNNEKPRMEYDYNGDITLEGELKERAIKCGHDLYNALGIAREDKQQRIEQWKKNYLSFNSPTAIFIFKHLDTGISGYMDCGMLIQSILLAATDLGLATCPQASLGHYPDIVKKELTGFDDYILLCGIAIGYEDTSAAVNNYRTEREVINNIVSFF
ncbi:nitroreductase [Francisella tularensis]|uniref:nitroreductase n=1 Tax=Francisella tularensis TaxID=263 RepID=UPI000173E3DE|nr:nitroreductase [Francisella tularensis]ACD30144.1 nitroreductase [Francisella tularensis subsp. mediasiatica FSC147]MBK2078350.1 nitroreductase [Francisella tularensis subsp. mediasiatica]MBK2100951.1 nitroreductase [Francisella tularensis subsp. mediasiatica]MBK2104034.1 nitroreductase [Francisella tularensis subsp. mediasiatica]MDN9002438.1 nitroreductase [Francisella tularensis subsp. mediasiatica]